MTSFNKKITSNNVKTLSGVLALLLVCGCSSDSDSHSAKLAPSIGPQTHRLHIAAAANLSPVLPKIIESYKQNNNLAADYLINVTYASSGKLYAQLLSGAPYDIFLSANQSYPEKLTETDRHSAFSASVPFTYTKGQLALYSPTKPLGNQLQLDSSSLKQLLLDNPSNKLTIANPEVAPYGNAAKELLERNSMYQPLIKDKRLVQAENIGQAFQYVHAGNVGYGLVAQSQLVAANVSESKYRRLATAAYPDILQDGIVITDKSVAIDFAQFMQSDVAQRLFLQAGYLSINPSSSLSIESSSNPSEHSPVEP